MKELQQKIDNYLCDRGSENLPIKDLNFQSRVICSLRELSFVHSLRDFVGMSVKLLPLLRNIGKVTYNGVLDILSSHGLQVKDGVIVGNIDGSTVETRKRIFEFLAEPYDLSEYSKEAQDVICYYKNINFTQYSLNKFLGIVEHFYLGVPFNKKNSYAELLYIYWRHINPTESRSQHVCAGNDKRYYAKDIAKNIKDVLRSHGYVFDEYGSLVELDQKNDVLLPSFKEHGLYETLALCDKKYFREQSSSKQKINEAVEKYFNWLVDQKIKNASSENLEEIEKDADILCESYKQYILLQQKALEEQSQNKSFKNSAEEQLQKEDFARRIAVKNAETKRYYRMPNTNNKDYHYYNAFGTEKDL